MGVCKSRAMATSPSSVSRTSRIAFDVRSPAKTAPFVRIDCSAVSLQGKTASPSNKQNQDSYFIIDQLEGCEGVALFGVFDGHGPFGTQVAKYCAKNATQVLLEETCFRGNYQEGHCSMFHKLHERFAEKRALLGERVIDATLSGVTCTSVMITPSGQLHVANAGDCRAVLARRNTNGSLEAVPLSVDHKPNRSDEKERIFAQGATILSEKEVSEGGRGSSLKFYACRKTSNEFYGVLFTRSIGDLDAHNRLGVVPDPEVQIFQMTSSDQFIILGTDGVWDFLTNDQVIQLVVDNSKSASKACQAIVRAAANAWESCDTTGKIDDITALVVFLNDINMNEVEA